MANFPIDIFHEQGKPNAPTFGIRLGTESRYVHKIDNFLGYMGAMFNAMRHYSTFTFIGEHEEYSKLIGYIDTKGHHWLNFNMDLDEKKELFYKGVKAAEDFLIKFDWAGYKKIREGKSNE